MEKKVILIVDDEIDITHMMKDVFELEGYEVLLAHNGLEALEVLKTNIPDVIVLDMNMPKMGGVSFYHRLIESDRRNDFAIIVLTAREELKSLFEELQVDGFIEKPFEMDHLQREIERVLDKRKTGGSEK